MNILNYGVGQNYLIYILKRFTILFLVCSILLLIFTLSGFFVYLSYRNWGRICFKWEGQNWWTW